MIHRFKTAKHATRQSIEIFVDRIEQLFNSMDPSPFHEKDLDHDAEEFIVSWAQEYHRHDPLVLRVHVNQYPTDRKSTRLNFSHLGISYAVFCLKKKKKN